jgi:hypothetical protein
MAAEVCLQVVHKQHELAGHDYFAYDPSEYNLPKQLPIMSRKPVGQQVNGNAVSSFPGFSMQIMLACFQAGERFHL